MNISAEEFHIHFISYANIPFKAGIYASDLSIDWGDGTSSILKEKQYFNIVHHYQQEGLFHIKISGHRISNQPIKFSRFTTRTLSFFGISELFDQ